ncbi:TOG array regulator of axonemal microtubules protein 1 isoform X2 [Salminus brasiliensis]|uniref:TOG array regulator of axonemal microtubules protein 1 isoform X2 n=1 Tax=Salminus brasiliensis TaxID=930266 RepID=UPI003B83957D
MMVCGLIPPELLAQLLDHEDYQNRTNGVEELKNIISELDLKTVSSDRIVEFIHFLNTLLDDTNFKVLYGTLQVINLLIQKLDHSVGRYYKLIVYVALKTLGDARTVPRNEYMNVFRHLMRVVGPQKILELVIGHLKHKNSRVREDVINIITAAMLTHPRKDFNIPDLCYVVAPYLADNKKRVRHAALELFAVFDYCLDTGKKQPLMKAIDRVELTGDMEGLMAAVQARRARHILPRLSADGMVEYALVIPKPGQRRRPQLCSGADLDWVLNGVRVNSAQSGQTELDSNGLSGYGSLGSLTDDHFLQRRIVSAGKGKNKLPWENSGLPCTVNQQPNSTSDEKSSDKSSIEDLTASLRQGGTQEPCTTNFETWLWDKIPDISIQSQTRVVYQGECAAVSGKNKEGLTEHFEPRSPGWRRETMGRLRRSGSLDSDQDVFKAASTRDAERGFPKPIQLLSGNNVGRTFSLPSNSPLSGSSLLPSCPLATPPVVQLTSTLPRRCHDKSSLTMSNTWPNKQEIRDPSPWKDNTGELSSSRCSPLPIRTSQASTTSASSFRQTLNIARSSATFPVTQQYWQDSWQNQSGQRFYLDLSLMTLQDQDEEPVDREEMKNSLRSLRNSAAKKRAKVSLSGSEPDPDSPDSAVRLEPTLDSSSHTSPSMISHLNESNLSSLCYPPTPIINSTKSSSGNSAAKTQIARVSSAKQKAPSCIEAVSQGVFDSIVFPTHSVVAACDEQEDSMSKVLWKSPAGVYGYALSISNTDSDESTKAKESMEKLKLSRLARGKINPQEAQSMQNEQMEHQDRMEEVQHLTHTMSDVNSNELTPLKDLQQSGSVLASTKTGAVTDDSSPTSLQAPQSPVKCFAPHHQPSPPTALPTRHTLPCRRRAISLNRARPSLSNRSGTPKKDPHEQRELRPFSKPDFALTQSFRLLNSDDWEKKIEGLTFLRSLVQYHSDVLISRLHDVCFVLIQEVRNLRSGVSRMAVVTLGELYSVLQKGMDQELDSTAKALLHKAGESNAFIRLDVDAALDCMVQNCTPTRSMSALINGGLGHLNAVVRKCTSQHLAALVEKMGAGRLLSGSKDLTDRIFPAVCKLVQDSSQETRYFGRRMLLLLSSHQDFDKMVVKYVSDKDLATIRDTVLSLKTKGLGEMLHDTPSARGRRSLPGGGLERVSSLVHELQHSHSKDKAQIHSIADKTEYIKQLKSLLCSKDFRERIKGIDQLVTDCEDSPYMVIGNMFPVFDAFKSRLQESNSKVNLYALEALQKIIKLLKDNLAQVVYILVPAIVDSHLNSKNDAIYMAAIGGIQALINNLDSTVLLQPFCTKAKFLSGKAKVDLVHKVAELINQLYPQKPQLVEQKVLPLLWHLLGTSSNSGTVHGRGGTIRGATSNLCQALYLQMGPALLDCASSQPSNIYQSLNDFLKNFSTP